MKRIFFVIALISGFMAQLTAQDSVKMNDPFLTFGANYIGDNVNNLSGGIKTGSCYLGMANIQLIFDTEKAGLWKGGSFYINATNTHGGTPSADLLGDMQVASNIEAGNHTFVQELHYLQTINHFEFTVGLQDLNVEFANSENGALFLNSSFGILPLISGNIAAPIFPLTALGFTAKWNISEKASWLNAIYDGSPTDFDYNPYNFNWQFNSGDGILAISELQFNTLIKELPGVYKMGFYSHNHIIEESLDKTIPDSINQDVFGFYTYADQKVWELDNRSLGLFVQMGYSPCNEITNNFFIGLGLNYTGLFSSKGSDILGVALAQEHFTNGTKSESALELSYKYQTTTNTFIQPDIQYIINPAGTGETLNNALAANIRFGISF
jgi:porin